MEDRDKPEKTEETISMNDQNLDNQSSDGQEKEDRTPVPQRESPASLSKSKPAGYWIQIFANIAIVGTLLITSYQISQNTDSLNLQTDALELQTNALRLQTDALEAQEFGQLESQQQDIFTLSMEHSATYTKALLTPQDLSVSELWIVTELIYIRLEMLERVIRANKNGIIPDEDLQNEYDAVPIYLGTEVGNFIWSEIKDDYSYNPVLQSNIDQSLASAQITPDDQFLTELYDKLQRL